MPEGVNWFDGEGEGEGQGPGDPQVPCLGVFGGRPPGARERECWRRGSFEGIT